MSEPGIGDDVLRETFGNPSLNLRSGRLCRAVAMCSSAERVRRIALLIRFHASLVVLLVSLVRIVRLNLAGLRAP